MAQYLKLNESEIRQILRKFGLEMIGYAPIEAGVGNTNFRIDTRHGEYILTAFEIGHRRVEKLSKLLHLLHRHQFQTSQIKKHSEGAEITRVRGHSVLLKPFIKGRVVKDPDKNMIGQVGQAIARLHSIPAPDYLPVQHAYGLHTFPALFDHGIDPEYENLLARRHEMFNQKIPSGLPRGLIHGDVFYDNVLFEGSTFKAIIDFEEACHYYFAFDLGMAVVGMCTQYSEVNLVKAAALIKGYQQIRELEIEEIKALQLFIEYAAMATSSWRFWKYHIDTQDSEKADMHHQMVEIANHVRSIPKPTFQWAVFSG